MPRTQNFKIRYAKEADFTSVFNMVSKVIPKLYPTQPVSEVKIKDLFDKGLDNEVFTCIVLVDTEDKPRGYVFACINELYFHPVQVATCLSIWIDEDCRGHSLDMIRAFERWATWRNANSLVLAEFDNLTPKGTSKILSRFGYTLKEKQYWKDI